MSKRPSTNKLWEPFSYVPPGACPKCGEPAMVKAERDTIFMLLDEDGIPSYPKCTVSEVFTCMNCDFTTSDYVCTDKGYRYNPYNQAEFLREIYSETRSETSTQGNPFIKEK